jgi:phosphoadenosine phosphosulfate reductase
LYDEGFARLGCVVCPFLKGSNRPGSNLMKAKERWPGMYRVLDITLNKLWDRDKEKLKLHNFTYEEFMSWPNWKTKEERKQMSLFCTNQKPCEVMNDGV